MNNTVTDLASLLAKSLSEGSGSARASFGDKATAFAWAPATINAAIAHVSGGVTTQRQFSTLTVGQSAEVTAWTAGEKPITATLTHEPHTAKAYPGVVQVTTSEVLDSIGLGQALNVALYRQALAALDKELVTALVGSANNVAKAADVAAIAEGQARLLADGFSPSLCIVSAATYADLAGKGLIAGGNNPQDAVVSVLGSRLVVSGALSGQSAVVLDPASVVAVEHESSPIGLVDVHARSNSADVVIEVVAGFAVVQPEGVASIKAATR